MKPEIGNRLAKARLFLAEAGRADPAVSPLSIVHDSYYAMFHAALAVLSHHLNKPPVKHATVIGEFGRLARDWGEEARRHGRALNDAQELRLASDYAPEIVPTAEDAARARDEAREFLAFCEKRLAG
jgi:uncharacterized protein (UPF0332 family)